MSQVDGTAFSSICRICGLESSDLISLFQPSAIEMGLLRKIEENLNLKIYNNDHLPCRICGSCIAKLDICDQFIKMAKNTNAKLHEIYTERLKKLTPEELQHLTCLYCDKKFNSPSILSLHLSTHFTASLFLCELCGNTFKNSEGLECHKRTHLDESKRKKHACSFCDKKFRSRFDLSEHANRHSGSRPYSCNDCGKAFHRRAQLRQHCAVHNGWKQRCSKCGKAFSRHSELRLHLRRHEVGRTFKCGVCSLSCPTISALLSHRKQHRPISTETEAKLSTQILPKSESDAKFRCDACGKQLSSRSSLLYHRKAVHGGNRDWSCEQCNKSFVTEKAKLIHERTHSGVRPFQCSLCKKTFMSSNVLNQHLKDHSETSSFECAHCHKKFKRKGALNVHLRIHNGELPFPCDVCGRSFNQKNDMLKHLRRMHNRPTDAASFTCEYCSCVFNEVSKLDEHKASAHKPLTLLLDAETVDLNDITEIPHLTNS